MENKHKLWKAQVFLQIIGLLFATLWAASARQFEVWLILALYALGTLYTIVTGIFRFYKKIE